MGNVLGKKSSGIKSWECRHFLFKIFPLLYQKVSIVSLWFFLLGKHNLNLVFVRSQISWEKICCGVSKHQEQTFSKKYFKETPIPEEKKNLLRITLKRHFFFTIKIFISKKLAKKEAADN